MKVIKLSGLIATIILFAFFGISCKKTTSTATGTVYIHLHTNIDTTEVDDTTTLYSDANGRHFSLTKAQFFVSNIILQNADRSSYTMKNAYILKGIDSEQYLVGTAPVGTYTSFKFNVGLDATTNARTPASFTPTGYLPSSEMWFGNTTQGYMFMKLQGFADTTTAQNGTNLMHFSYEIGSATNLKSVTMPLRSGTYSPYTLVSGGVIYLHLICDYGKLLSVIDFKSQPTTDTYNTNPAIAISIANNFSNLFEYEE